MIFLHIILFLYFDKSFQFNEVHKDKHNKVYMGENFPSKYFEVEPPEPSDLDIYLDILPRTFNYFASKANETDVNTSLGCYLIPALFKNLLRYHGEKISRKRQDIMKKIIDKAQFVLSHYIYKYREKDWEDLNYRVALFFKDDVAIVNSVGNFQRGNFRKVILSKVYLHEFIQEMDAATLDRAKYAKLVSSMDDYYMNIDDSDECLSRVGYIMPALDPTGDLQRCKPDPFCDKAVQKGPSVAYALSHRFFNLMIRHLAKRCYITTINEDIKHMHLLCSFMYREAVYIARRGFFARDMFAEHITLCATLGYEEFLRDSWLWKVASWFDEHGCLKENRNFGINSTNYLILRAGDDLERATRVRKRMTELHSMRCQHHAMILGAIVLALGVKHIIHHMPSPNISRINDEL